MVQFFLRNKLSILVISLTVLLLGGSYFSFLKKLVTAIVKTDLVLRFIGTEKIHRSMEK